MTASGILIRAARLDDVPAMARVHVQSWRETYRGVMTDAALDDPELVPTRERFWTAALTDPRYADNRAAVAVRDGQLVGVAMSGPPLSEGPWQRQLYVIYLLTSAHGSGAGTELLDAVVDAAESAVLWVSDPNPRAQAFYRRQGFVRDGGEAIDFGVREIRMCRPGP